MLCVSLVRAAALRLLRRVIAFRADHYLVVARPGGLDLRCARKPFFGLLLLGGLAAAASGVFILYDLF